MAGPCAVGAGCECDKLPAGCRCGQGIRCDPCQAAVDRVDPLAGVDLAEAAREADAWALANGLVLVDGAGRVASLPVTLAPSAAAIPRATFEGLRRIAPVYNRLVMAAVQDRPFLLRALAGAAAADDGFTGRLVEIMRAADAAPHAAALHMALVRSDYMLDAGGAALQVCFDWVVVSRGGPDTFYPALGTFLLSSPVGRFFHARPLQQRCCVCTRAPRSLKSPISPCRRRRRHRWS